MSQKGFVNIISIGIVVVLLGIGGYFVWLEYGPQPCAKSLLPAEAVNKKTGEKKIFEYPCAVPRGWIITDYHPATTLQPTSTPTPQPSPTPTPVNETADWKTYRSPDPYKFILEYPALLVVDEDIISPPSWPFSVDFFDPNNNAEYLLVNIHKLKADEYISKIGDKIISRSTVDVNGKKMTYIKSSSAGYEENYLIEHGEYLYVILVNPAPGLQKTANTMLQSFKIE